MGDIDASPYELSDPDTSELTPPSKQPFSDPLPLAVSHLDQAKQLTSDPHQSVTGILTLANDNDLNDTPVPAPDPTTGALHHGGIATPDLPAHRCNEEENNQLVYSTEEEIPTAPELTSLHQLHGYENITFTSGN